MALNKHGFSPNGHDKKSFDEFCEISSKLDAFGLLYFIVERWCDDGDLVDITTMIKDSIEENSK